MKTFLLRLWLIGLCLMSQQVLAHKPSDSYLILQENQVGKTELRWDIALRDLEQAIGLDSDQDGKITWGELRQQQAVLQAYALSRLTIQQANQACGLTAQGLQTDTHTDGAYAVLHYAVGCPNQTGPLKINYQLLFDIDPTHRGILLDKRPNMAASSVLFSPEKTQVVLNETSTSGSGLAVFFNYLYEGIYHILIGIDHLLFIGLLILPSVLVVNNRQWLQVDHYKQALFNLLKVVTAFTVAHSITLSLAVLGLVNLPTWLVESAIAFSIILLAVNIMYPVITHDQWKLAFGFGLLHGFGFAVVLMDLEMPKATLAQALLGFNIGVEMGQLLVVSLLFPLVYVLRTQKIYRVQILHGSAFITLVISSIWFIERAFDMSLIGI